MSSADVKLLSIHFNLNWPGGQSLFNWEEAVLLEASAFPQLERYSDRLSRYVVKHFTLSKGGLFNSPASVSDYFLLKRHFTAWVHVYIDVLMANGFTPSTPYAIDSRLAHVVQALDKHSLKEAYKEQTFAKNVNLSVSTLNRLFVSQFSVTPRQYFEKRKLDEAMERIRSAVSVKEVAFALGFSSLQHFSSWFKRKTGMPPSHLQHPRQVARLSEAIR